MPNDLDGDQNVYLETVNRLEPDIAMIDRGAFYASAAISLKRIADTLEPLRALHPILDDLLAEYQKAKAARP